jgi:hypothetical protein
VDVMGLVGRIPRIPNGPRKPCLRQWTIGHVVVPWNQKALQRDFQPKKSEGTNRKALKKTVIHPVKKEYSIERKTESLSGSTLIVTVRKTVRKDKSEKFKVSPNLGQSCCRNADKVL